MSAVQPLQLLANPCNNVTMRGRHSIALALCLALISCGEEPTPSGPKYVRVMAAGDPSCLGELTGKLGSAGFGVARFPEWKSGRGVIEYGLIPASKASLVTRAVKDSGCATFIGTRSSCRVDHGDVAFC